MNEAIDMELEIVDLGDAKQETKGVKGMNFEDNLAFPNKDPE